MTVARSSAHMWSTVTTLVCSLLTLARIDLAHAQETAPAKGAVISATKPKPAEKAPSVSANRVQERAIV